MATVAINPSQRTTRLQTKNPSNIPLRELPNDDHDDNNDDNNDDYDDDYDDYDDDGAMIMAKVINLTIHNKLSS